MIADRIRAGDQSAHEDLYALVRAHRGMMRVMLHGSCREDEEDILHDAYLACARANLNDPSKMPALVYIVVRRLTIKAIHRRVRARNHIDLANANLYADVDIHADAERAQKLQITRSTLRTLRPRDRQVIIRFYLKGETWQDICRDMRLTPIQFRNFKSRAKAKLSERGKLAVSEKG